MSSRTGVAPIIRVEGLSKEYRINTGTTKAPYMTLRDRLAEAARKPFKALERGRRAEGESMWALKDVNFEISPGETVGFVGRNGAGKSTLLKILSRITEPTAGRVELFGRVASLLEVGTGFNLELTGRENVYLNGAILGMSRVEIERKFDEIVDFSGVEKFIDTPVKFYSSGMYLRLAFAIAAYMEPEILIVDEVLAVGDAEFQKKCLGQMEGAAAEGRTVLFVSHDASAVQRLCDRAILLEEGSVAADGPAHQVVSTYLGSNLEKRAARRWTPGEAPSDDVARLVSVRARTEDGETASKVSVREPVGIEMEYEVIEPGHVLVPNFHFFNEEGVCAFVSADHDRAWRGKPRPVGRYVSTVWIPGDLLSEGKLLAGPALSTMEPVVVHFYEPDAIAFEITDSFDGESARGDFAGHIPGVVRPLLRWSTHFDEANDTLASPITRETTP